MGPVAKRGIPVRQNSASRKLPPPCVGSDNGRDSVDSFELKTRIGSQVRVGGAKTGTLLFCGKTSFSDGVWCGVSLDDASGKNDGSVNGVRYFTCAPAHGVFVRSSKIEFLPSVDSGEKTSITELLNVVEEPEVVEVAPRFRLTVPTPFKRPGGSVSSGRIQKHSSAQKTTGLKRKFLLDANLNSTTTIFSKETRANSNENLADGVENDPLRIRTMAAVPVKSRLQIFQGRPPNVKPTEPSRVGDNLPSSLNSTITINLNSTVTVPYHHSNDGDKISSLTPEQASKLSVKEKCSTGSGCNKLSAHTPKSLVLDSTFEVADCVKSQESLSRRSLELFMNLSPSKVSSPLVLQTENPNNNSFLDHSFESTVAHNLTFDGKLLQCDGPSNSGDVGLHSQRDTSCSLVSFANQTVVIESPITEDQRLNCTFQVDDHTKHVELMVLPEDHSPPGSRIDVVEHSIAEANCVSASNADDVHQTDFSDLQSPILSNNTFVEKKEICSPCSTKVRAIEFNLSSTEASCEKAGLPCLDFSVNTTVCIKTKASSICAAKSAGDGTFIASPNETFCCSTKDTVSPNTNRTILNCSSLHQREESLACVDNCEELATTEQPCMENPISSTPAFHTNKGHVFSSLFTPIQKSGNRNGHPTSLDKSSTVPGSLTRSGVVQDSDTSDQSLGILSQSQMQDFTVVDSTCNSLGDGSPVSMSFCNRMFPVDADDKLKRRLSTVLEFDVSPECLQRQSMKKVDSVNTFSPWALNKLDDDSVFFNASKNMLGSQSFPENNGDKVKLPRQGDLEHESIFDVRKNCKRILAESINDESNIDVSKPLAKCGKWLLSDSLLDRSACAAVKLSDDSLLDLSAYAATQLPDDSF